MDIKISIVLAFGLTVISYAIFLKLQPEQPLDAKSTLIVFIFWLGLAVAVGRFLAYRRRKRDGKNV